MEALSGPLGHTHHWHAVHADLPRRTRKRGLAAVADRSALGLTDKVAEQRLLRRRLER